jgi:FkbM family methyltransferase
MTSVETVDLTIAGRAIRFRGNPSDAYFRGLPAFHAHAPRLEQYVRANLPRNAVCLDVGANIGLTAILLSLHCPQGRVYAFEASPTNVRFLRENLSLNNIGNCVVLDTAVGDREGTVEFYESVFSAGSHVSNGRRRGAADLCTVVVPVTTLDRVAEGPHLKGRRVDFIKLDVEGYEPAVLAGAARLCERDRPAIFNGVQCVVLAGVAGIQPRGLCARSRKGVRAVHDR